MAMNILIPKSSYGRKAGRIDSVQERIDHYNGQDKVNIGLLRRAEEAWESLHDLRTTRLRNLRYVFGDQWGDLVKDDNGHLVTERERIARKTGDIVLQNNHLIKVVNTLTGLYSKTATNPVCFALQKDADRKSKMMTNALQTNWCRNQEKDLLVNEMYEMICGGVACVTEQWDTHDGIEDSYTYPVNPAYLFWESHGNDPRHWDMSLIGEIKDYTLGELTALLASNRYDYEQLKQIYNPWLHRYDNRTEQTTQHENINWTTPPSNNLCRTYHIWTLEYKERIRCRDDMDLEQPLYKIEVEDLPAIKAENASRLEMGMAQGMEQDEIPLIETQYIVDQYWHFQMLAPDGRVLTEYDTPYQHNSHPYIIKMHQYINGNVIPFISVVIDQQRYINRLISLTDMAIKSAAKGIKMIPTSVIPKDMTEKEFAEKFVQIGEFIFYTPDPKMPSAKPEVITTNSTNIGTAELLQLELGFVNDITSTSEALQGKSPGNGTSASRYAMETQNSTTSVSTLMNKFSVFENEVARKKMKTIHQYYQEERNISQSRSNGYAEYSMYEPQEVADIDFEVNIKESAETPVARMMMNDLMMQLWQQGAVSAIQMLQHSYYPGADEILQDLQSQQEAVQQGQAPQQLDTNAMQQLSAQANPDTMQMVDNALRSAQ